MIDETLAAAIRDLDFEAAPDETISLDVTAEATALGVDPESVHPQIDWPSMLAMDSYEAPKYVSNETRRRAAVEFFRRPGE